MGNSIKEEGVIEAILERLEKLRLPRLLDLEKKVNNNEKLNELELEFLTEAIKDTRSMEPMVEKHPEFQVLASKVISLYTEITEKALLLEKTS